MFLSILSGSGRSRGEGKFGRNAGGKALFSPHPALLFCLLFSVFYSSVLRLGVSAPVCASCSLGEEKRFVCFHDCQQTSGWKCLTTVQPFQPLLATEKSPLPSQPSGKRCKVASCLRDLTKKLNISQRWWKYSCGCRQQQRLKETSASPLCEIHPERRT